MSCVILISTKYEKPRNEFRSKNYIFFREPVGYFIKSALNANGVCVTPDPQEARIFETNRDALRVARRLRVRFDTSQVDIDILEIGEVKFLDTNKWIEEAESYGLPEDGV